MLAQVLGGAGLAAGITVGALIAADLLGGEGFAGLPIALFTLGSGLTAFLLGRVARRRGRRISLSGGFFAGAVGAVGVIIAAATVNLPLLFLALFVYGAGTATNLQARYAATDLALPDRRGQAVSRALVWTTVGAVAGPNLVAPLGGFAASLGLPPLTGPFLLAAVAYAGAGLAITILMRPDPLLLSRRIEEQEAASAGPRSVGRASRRLVVAGAVTMVCTQVAMVATMTMTPVAMHHHGHGIGAVGLVISAHVAAMYLPSPLSGWLADRYGRTVTALAAGAVLLAAGLVAGLASGDSLVLMMAGLMLLGLGWNLGLLAGTALVVDGTLPHTRPQTQGSIDVLIALSGAGAGVSSGLLVAATNFATLAIVGGLIGLLLVPVLTWAARDPTPAAA
nr:MFS transporter [Kineosphaera limosa]